MKRSLRPIASALLVLLFAYAVISKLADIGQFRHEMHNQHFPPEVAEALVWLVPVAELAAIALLLHNRWQYKGLVFSSALMAMFTGYVGLALAGFWDEVPCSCGGVLRNLSWTAHFFFNLFFLAVALCGLFIGTPVNAGRLVKTT